MKRILFAVILVVVGVLIASKFMSREDWYQIQDAIERINAPDFNWDLNSIEPWEQAAVMRDYERRGYKLHCATNLRVEEKITKNEDTQCWAIIKSAYKIPANDVTFVFDKKKLKLVRIEFKEKSADELKEYLGVKLDDANRLDTRPGENFGVDTYGKKLHVWRTDSGIVVTSEHTAGTNSIVTWWAEENR